MYILQNALNLIIQTEKYMIRSTCIRQFKKEKNHTYTRCTLFQVLRLFELKITVTFFSDFCIYSLCLWINITHCYVLQYINRTNQFMTRFFNLKVISFLVVFYFLLFKNLFPHFNFFESKSQYNVVIMVNFNKILLHAYLNQIKKV